MQLEVAGKRYTGFQRAVARIRLDQMTNTFEFTASTPGAVSLPFVAGQSCRVYVDDEQVMSAWIEGIEIAGSADNHSILIRGRDRTCDIADSKFGAMQDIKPPVTLKRVIELCQDHLGGSVGVRDLVRPAAFETTEDLGAPEPGGSVATFLEALARKRQVLLSSDAHGRVVITGGQPTRVAQVLRHHVDDPENNVLSYAVGYDYSGLYNRYEVRSQLNPAIGGAGIFGEQPDEKVVDQSGVKIDAQSRVGRLFAVVGESAASDGSLQKRAEWQASINRARTVVYSCTVHGFRGQDGRLWAVNTAPQVHEEYAGIEDRMLINSVEFEFDKDQGRNTNLTLIPEDAYVLELATPTKLKKTGGGFAWGGLEEEEKKQAALQEAVEQARAAQDVVEEEE